MSAHIPSPTRPAAADARGCPVSGASEAALQAYEAALEAFQTWRCGAEQALDAALREAPAFAMAHVLQGYLRICSRDPRRVRAARPIAARCAGLTVNPCERLHLAALEAVLADDYELAKSRLGELLRMQPHDVLALQVAHALDYLTGDALRMRERVATLLPAWSVRLPGYGAVLAMYAFSLEECAEYARAEDAARAALALNPLDARAHHVMAHVFEMSGRAEFGLHWMSEHAAGWDLHTTVATHCCWHVALFHLARGHVDLALALYDRRIRAGGLAEMADLIDASALLWRIRLRGGDAGPRWTELATAWSPHIEDRFCSFNDIHAMLAFVGARDWPRARQLELSLVGSAARPTRHGTTTRQLGLGACRALAAFGRGDNALASGLLRALPASLQRLGGSHAQRDVLQLTMQEAVDRARRPAAREADTAVASGLGSWPPGGGTRARQPSARAAPAVQRPVRL